MMTSSHLKETKENKWKQEEKQGTCARCLGIRAKEVYARIPRVKPFYHLSCGPPFSSLLMSCLFLKKETWPLYSTKTLLINLGPSKQPNPFIFSHVAPPNVGPSRWLRTWGLPFFRNEIPRNPTVWCPRGDEPMVDVQFLRDQSPGMNHPTITWLDQYSCALIFGRPYKNEGYQI